MTIEISPSVLSDLTAAAKLEHRRAELLGNGQPIPQDLELALRDLRPAQQVAEEILHRLGKNARA